MAVVRDEINDNTERQPDVCQREPREDQGEDVVLRQELSDAARWSAGGTTYECLNVEEEHADDAVA